MNVKEYYRNHSLKLILSRIDKYYGLGRLEEIISSRWFNPFTTLWLNFRLLPLSQSWKLPVWAFGRPRLRNLSGRIEIAPGVKVKSGMLRFNMGRIGCPDPTGGNSELYLCGRMKLHGKCVICTSCAISVMQDGVLSLGKGTLICESVNIGCISSVTIGDDTWVVHRSQVFDTNYHSMTDLASGDHIGHVKPVSIGRGCWICNSSTIGPGSVLPDYTTVASHSLTSRDYSSEIPTHSIIGGIPARLIRTGQYRRDNLPS